MEVRRLTLQDAPAYRAGWERGQEYRRRVGIGAELKKSA